MAGFGKRADAVAIRLDELGSFAGALSGHRPIVAFVDQGLEGARVGGPAGIEQSQELGLSRSLFPLQRVIFVIDRSGSMEGPLHAGTIESKLGHIKEKIAGIKDSYFPDETQISLIYFDHNHQYHEYGSTGSGAIELLRAGISSLTPGGQTEFSEPLSSAVKILEADRYQAIKEGRDLQGAGLRSLVFFLSDGQDQSKQSVTHEIRKIRDLNATTFVCGIGEDYNMSRILKIASNAGPAAWSHIPLEAGEANVFDVQIPAIISQLISEENYLQLQVHGSYRRLVAVTPSIRGLPSSESIIRMGYEQSTAGIVFEAPGRDDIGLELRASRHISDRSPGTQDVSIVDAADAGYMHERIEAAKNFVDRYLILEALRKHDAGLLRQMRDVRPDLASILDSAIQDFEKQQSGAYGGSQSIHSAMTMTGMTQGLTRGIRPAPSRRDPMSNAAPYAHSGGLGGLSHPVPSYIPPADKPNAAAYNDLQPRPKRSIAYVKFSSPLVILDGRAQHFQDFGLGELDSGRGYVFGRQPTQKNGGSPEDVAVTLDGAPSISRVHFRIFAQDGKYFIEDQGSTFGTTLNGETLVKGTAKELKSGDVIRIAEIGNMTFVRPAK